MLETAYFEALHRNSITFTQYSDVSKVALILKLCWMYYYNNDNIYMYVRMYLCMYVCTYVCMYVCVYIYIQACLAQGHSLETAKRYYRCTPSTSSSELRASMYILLN